MLPQAGVAGMRTPPHVFCSEQRRGCVPRGNGI